MPHSIQAKKRVRQSEKLRVKNKSTRNEIKTLTKTLKEKAQAGDLEGAKVLFRKVVSKLDKAARKGIFHRNAAARRKSEVALIINKVVPPQAAAPPKA
jgi:small subunit ribosomal protein S20